MKESKIYNEWNTLYLKKVLTGTTTSGGNALLIDFIIVALKLERLGFTYRNGSVLIVMPADDIINI